MQRGLSAIAELLVSLVATSSLKLNLNSSVARNFRQGMRKSVAFFPIRNGHLP